MICDDQDSLEKDTLKLNSSCRWFSTALEASAAAEKALRAIDDATLSFVLIERKIRAGDVIDTGVVTVEEYGTYIGKTDLSRLPQVWKPQNLALVYAGEQAEQQECICGLSVLSTYAYCPYCGQHLKTNT